MTKNDLITALDNVDEKYVKSIDVFYKTRPTWRCLMKRSVRFAISAAVVILLIAGFCLPQLFLKPSASPGGQPDPLGPGSAESSESPTENSRKLRICFDLGSYYDLDPLDQTSQQKKTVDGMIDTLCLNGRVYGGLTENDIEVEIIPSDNSQTAERETMLQRIRTEIMTGGGPDVFVCCTEGLSATTYLRGPRLFPYAVKAMEEHFLPLDDYLDGLTQTEWSDLDPEILAGGKNSKGEMVLFPMRYSLPSLIYRKEDAPGRDLSGMSWEDLLTESDPDVAQLLRWGWNITNIEEQRLIEGHETGLSFIHPSFMDVSGSLTVTEDELTDLIWDQIEPTKKLLAQEPAVKSFVTLPDRTWFENDLFEFGMVPNDNQYVTTFLPVRNYKGGTTAVIYSYCAVNRNTEMPEEAVSVLDYLMSESTQKIRLDGMPVNQKALARESTWMNEPTIQEWKKAAEEINRVYFPSPLDTALDEMMKDVQVAMVKESGIEMNPDYSPDYYVWEFYKGSISKEELSAIVHEHYGKMQRLLDES